MDKLIVKFFSFLILLFTTSTVLAGSMQVSISGISSESRLYIDLIDGDGPSNSIALSSFTTDGSITLKELTGSAASTPTGYDVSDTSFLNSVGLSLANVTSLNFLISFSNNAPLVGNFLDSIGVYLYADDNFNPLVLTDDPLGGNALFNWFATGNDNGNLQVFSSLSASPLTWDVRFVDTQVPVSESGSLALLLLSIASLFLIRMKNQEV